MPSADVFAPPHTPTTTSTRLPRRLALILAAMWCALAAASGRVDAQSADQSPLKGRNIGIPREAAEKRPRNEADQALAAGWPLYRTERGQAAFNDTMAALAATEGAAPPQVAFRGCTRLACRLALPSIGADGLLPAGRYWVSPNEYMLIAHSPRSSSFRRRSAGQMRYLVLHEFHNSSGNTDLFDTISSHKRAVFVPLYMSKEATDAKGRRFVMVVQVAPYDVVSIHATNYGSAGPGMEVAKNRHDAIDPLQEQAGILVAQMITSAAPRLMVVNHHGAEGRPMLEAWERRQALLRQRPGEPAVPLPFVPAAAQKVAAATGRLDALIAWGRRTAVRLARMAAPEPVPELVAPPQLAVRPQRTGTLR